MTVSKKSVYRNRAGAGRLLAGACLLAATQAWAQSKPNILVIWGDDVGRSNISAYTMGMMGYPHPEH